MRSDSYTAQQLIEKLQDVEWAGTTYELPVWLYEAVLDHLNRSTGPNDTAVALLREALREQRRWRSCQSIGACRQCVDDGVTLRIKTFLDTLDATGEKA